MKLTNISDQSPQRCEDLEDGTLFRAPVRDSEAIYKKHEEVSGTYGRVIVSEKPEKIGKCYGFGKYELIREVEIVEIRFKDK